MATRQTVQEAACDTSWSGARDASSTAPAVSEFEARLARLETQYAAGLEACARLIDFCIELLDDLHGRA